MQAAAHVVERGAVSCQCIGFFVDVFEEDVAGADGGQQLVALPVDPGIANGATRVVPDDEVISLDRANDITSPQTSNRLTNGLKGKATFGRRFAHWEFIPGPTIQNSAGLLLIHAAPLLKMKGNVCRIALISN